MCLDLIAREIQNDRQREAREARLSILAASGLPRHQITIKHLLARLGSHLVQLDPQDYYCVPAPVQSALPDRMAFRQEPERIASGTR
jgi:hypothetical protein